MAEARRGLARLAQSTSMVSESGLLRLLERAARRDDHRTLFMARWDGEAITDPKRQSAGCLQEVSTATYRLCTLRNERLYPAQHRRTERRTLEFVAIPLGQRCTVPRL